MLAVRLQRIPLALFGAFWDWRVARGYLQGTVRGSSRLRSHDFWRILYRECCYGLLRWSHGNDHHADQNKQSPQNRSQAKRFAAQEIPNKNSHNRIHVRVGPDFRRRFMMNQPHVGGKPDDRARDDQVEQRKPRAAWDG